MVDENLIRALLKQHFNCTGAVSIDEQGYVSVAGIVIYTTRNMSRMPPEIQFLHVAGSFNCSFKPQLESLVGAPQSVGGGFYCSNNPKLESLKGAPQSVGGDFACGDNPKLESLEGLPQKIGGKLYISYTAQLPLLRTLGVKQGVEFLSGDAEKVAEIINRYAGEGRRAMFKCKKELIEAGFPENARW